MALAVTELLLNHGPLFNFEIGSTLSSDGLVLQPQKFSFLSFDDSQPSVERVEQDKPGSPKP
ncbi:hypothetical protein [Nitrospira sp. BLG_2]|uniref:hypothetical protein n=1 Tax=Nitrospira sp. BLG_2 TaxID=3397507 RepID=UPI003B9B16B4